jgi:hypothetical protein
MYCDKAATRKPCLCVSFGNDFLVERRVNNRCQSIADCQAKQAPAQSLGVADPLAKGCPERKSKNLLSGSKKISLPSGTQTGSSKAR